MRVFIVAKKYEDGSNWLFASIRRGSGGYVGWEHACLLTLSAERINGEGHTIGSNEAYILQKPLSPKNNTNLEKLIRKSGIFWPIGEWKGSGREIVRLCHVQMDKNDISWWKAGGERMNDYA